ncbi:MAG: hypothetical protein IT317_20770 [Anaerolineales bacterium]|nr:hypothetical protein [Anaerolineales bacterium]
MPPRSLRFTGLVAGANRVRAQLAAGVPPEQAAAFREWVRATVAQVESACHTAGLRPTDLAGPSYRAYQFLRQLDLTHLPAPSAASAANGAAPNVTLRLRHFIPLARDFNERLAPLAGVSEAAAAAPAANIAAEAARQVGRVEALLAEHNAGPSQLPVQSRQAFQWLGFLGDPENVLAVIAALGLAQHLLAAARWPRRPALADAPVRLEFYPLAYLYRMRPEGKHRADLLRVTFSPGYLYAPPEVLEAVLRAALGFARPPLKAALHAYANSDDYAETNAALELLTAPLPGSLRGRHYDLDQVFDAVNAAYFGGALARPRLTWSRVITGRLLGYYQRSGDRLMISQALDDPRVPRPAIELVMYHELLHKQLGVQVVNGRHYAHTEAFRQAERQFAGYAEAQAFLARLGAPA